MVSLRRNKLPQSFELNANITNNRRKDEIGLGSPTCCSRKGDDPDRSQTCHVNSCDTFGYFWAASHPSWLPAIRKCPMAAVEPFRIAAVVQKGMRQKVQLKTQTQQSPVLAVVGSTPRVGSPGVSWGPSAATFQKPKRIYRYLQYQYKDLWYAMV